MKPEERSLPNTSSLWQTIKANVQLRHRASAIQPVSRHSQIPLSHAQERLWLLYQLNPTNIAHHLRSIQHFHGKLNITALEKSFGELIHRHEILRTTFATVDGQAVQKIATDVNFQLPVVDLRTLTETERETQLQQLIDKSLKAPFDLTQEPAWRVKLVRLSEEEFVLIRVMHHIISDAWSGNIFLQEISALYEAFVTGKTAQLPALPIQYADVAVWQRQELQGERWTALINYWKQQLGNEISALQLPIDFPRSSRLTHQGRSQSFTLSEQLTRDIKALSHQEGVSLFVTLLAAFKALLFAYSGQTDLVVCSPIANRQHRETQKLIGYFNNILAIRTELSGNLSFRDYLHRVSQVTVEAQEHQDLPFQTLFEFPNMAQTPLNRAMFGLQNTPSRPFKLVGIEIKSPQREQETADFELFLSMKETLAGLEGKLQYKTDLFKAQTIVGMVENFQILLESIVANLERSIEDLLLSLQTQQINDSVNREIETILVQHPKIEKTIVISRENQHLDQYLVAYIVPNQNQVPTPEELRNFLKQQIANDRIPVAFVPLEALPLNVNGKIDRRSLPAPDWQQQTQQTFVDPRNPIEEQLAEIWKNVLWREQPVGIHDNFFELGGHSLLAVRLVAEIENSFNTKMPLAALFQLTTVAELAECLAELEPENSPQTTESSVEVEKKSIAFLK